MTAGQTLEQPFIGPKNNFGCDQYGKVTTALCLAWQLPCAPAKGDLNNMLNWYEPLRALQRSKQAWPTAQAFQSSLN